MDDGLDLTGQVAIVTGAGRGLGRNFALEIAQSGGAVALVGRNPDNLDAVASETKAMGGHSASFVADVRDADAAASTVTATEAQLGPVTILVNNAALMLDLGLIATLDAEEFWAEMAVNVQGPRLWTKAVLETMLGRRAGRVINLTSSAGGRVIPTGSAYCCSKAALTMFTAVLGLELAGTGVVTFALAPLAATESTRAIAATPGISPEQQAFLPCSWQTRTGTSTRPCSCSGRCSVAALTIFVG